jgi:predicted nucleic acid-binding protein
VFLSEEVLKRPDLVSGLAGTDVDAFLAYLFRMSTLVPSVFSFPAGLSDPDDEAVLNLAAQQGAIIVSYNKRDFTGASAWGVTVLAPAEFLVMLRSLYDHQPGFSR